MNDNLARVIDVNINDILPNRFQPRIHFNEEEILELSDSIKEHGVIQPLVVRTIGDKYEIIAGERRYKASVLAGKETVPVIVKNLNDKDSAEIALIENIQRKNLTPIEEALSYKKILELGYITQENLATKLGKSQPSIANKIRLLNLSDDVQEALLENKISERHARSLLKLDTSQDQNKMLNRIITERLTVRRTDEEIEKLKNSNESESDDSQKIIEKGEMNMNENNLGIPNVPQTPSFDIFGAAPTTPAPEIKPQETSIATPSFDIFGGSPATSQSQAVPSPTPEVPSMNFVDQPQPVSNINNPTPTVQTVPQMPEIPSVTEDVQIPQIQVEQPQPTVVTQPTLNENVTQSITPSPVPMQSINDVTANNISIPTIENQVEPVTEMTSVSDLQPQPVQQPTINEQPQPQNFGPQLGIDSNTNLNVVEPAPQEEVQPIVNPNLGETPALDIPAQPSVPQTSPIIESQPEPTPDSTQVTQQSEDVFSFGDTTSQPNTPQPEPTQTSSVPEFKMPEPIIVTDYNKQYDPVMPQTTENMVPKVDFKEVITAIRDCSSKIEQYGFKIDVEEYDLSNLYQVIFKIEK